MGSPPNEAIHDCVARLRRLARQSWKNPPSGCLPEDARQSEERELSRGLTPLAASLNREGRAGPQATPSALRVTASCSHPGPVLAGDDVSESYSLSFLLDQEGFHIFASTVELSR